ncbi:MAG: NAD(P)-dependent oxidoreductase, partial [Synergistaceae bacterium]|nr:NAD(P)-dependent oxidoreductase [Synergistaceae bacterium]
MANFKFDVCSIGTGIMGSTSAAALAGAGKKVALWGR